MFVSAIRVNVGPARATAVKAIITANANRTRATIDRMDTAPLKQDKTPTHTHASITAAAFVAKQQNAAHALRAIDISEKHSQKAKEFSPDDAGSQRARRIKAISRRAGTGCVVNS